MDVVDIIDSKIGSSMPDSSVHDYVFDLVMPETMHSGHCGNLMVIDIDITKAIFADIIARINNVIDRGVNAVIGVIKLKPSTNDLLPAVELKLPEHGMMAHVGDVTIAAFVNIKKAIADAIETAC